MARKNDKKEAYLLKQNISLVKSTKIHCHSSLATLNISKLRSFKTANTHIISGYVPDSIIKQKDSKT